MPQQEVSCAAVQARAGDENMRGHQIEDDEGADDGAQAGEVWSRDSRAGQCSDDSEVESTATMAIGFTNTIIEAATAANVAIPTTSDDTDAYTPVTAAAITTAGTSESQFEQTDDGSPTSERTNWGTDRSQTGSIGPRPHVKQLKPLQQSWAQTHLKTDRVRALPA